ncbi:MAG TPA: LPXTG cell wall anchor domain-containing protein, partial [Patescibacteria group bacterium]
INTAGKDVVDCASNQSGSYTITATGGADVGTTGTTVTPTPTSGTLPQTGGISTTFGLILVGLSSMIGALFLRGL